MSESKGGESKDDYYYSEGKDSKSDDNDSKSNYNQQKQLVKIDVTKINIEPSGVVDLSSPLELNIGFELDNDVNESYWIIKLLVDSCDKRIIKILGKTELEDYLEGDSDMFFNADNIDVSGISPSVLANSGLLMACFIVNGKEIASVNMVCIYIIKSLLLISLY
jgi:hypothetical protein